MSDTQVKEVIRLERTQYNALRNKVGGLHACRVSADTTPLQAGFQLGVQHVLTLLEEGFTLAPSST